MLLAVAIGAAALSFIVTLARSGGATITQGIEAAGGRGLALVLPRSGGDSRSGEVPKLTERDAEALAQGLGPQVEVLRLAFLPKQVAQVGRTRVRVDVALGEHHRSLAFPRLAVGRDALGLHEVTLSHDAAKSLFGGATEAMGGQVLLWGHGYRVVGVASSERVFGFNTSLVGSAAAFLTDDAVAQREGITLDHFGFVRHGTDVSHAEVVTRMRGLLDARHRTVQSFTVLDIAALLESFDASLMALQVLVGAVAFLALLVAGVGIMNVSLASVNERVREFGIRRALGATRASLRRQVLLEAVLLAGSGAIVGCAVGFGGSGLLGIALGYAVEHWQHHLEAGVAFVAIGVSFLVALVFGLQPARAAGRLDVVSCLRGGR